jgi:hypothetical protein
MPQRAPHRHPAWTTSSFGGSADTSHGELHALGEHLRQCRPSSSRWFELQCAAENMNGFMVARFATTLFVLVSLCIGFGSMVV